MNRCFNNAVPQFIIRRRCNRFPVRIQFPENGDSIDALTEIVGIGKPGREVVVYIDQLNPLLGEIGTNGFFNIPNIYQLAPGPHQVTVQYRRRHRQGDIPCTIVFFTTGNGLLAPIIAYPLEESTLENNSFITVSGFAHPGNTVSICITNFGCIETIVLADGSFNHTFAGPFPDGEYTLTATQRDAAGDISQETTRRFNVITIAPLYQNLARGNLRNPQREFQKA